MYYFSAMNMAGKCVQRYENYINIVLAKIYDFNFKKLSCNYTKFNFFNKTQQYKKLGKVNL